MHRAFDGGVAGRGGPWGTAFGARGLWACAMETTPFYLPLPGLPAVLGAKLQTAAQISSPHPFANREITEVPQRLCFLWLTFSLSRGLAEEGREKDYGTHSLASEGVKPCGFSFCIRKVFSCCLTGHLQNPFTHQGILEFAPTHLVYFQNPSFGGVPALI